MCGGRRCGRSWRPAAPKVELSVFPRRFRHLPARLMRRQAVAASPMISPFVRCGVCVNSIPGQIGQQRHCNWNHIPLDRFVNCSESRCTATNNAAICNFRSVVASRERPGILGDAATGKLNGSGYETAEIRKSGGGARAPIWNWIGVLAACGLSLDSRSTSSSAGNDA